MMLNYLYEGSTPSGFREEDLTFVNFRALSPKKVGYTDPRSINWTNYKEHTPYLILANSWEANAIYILRF